MTPRRRCMSVRLAATSAVCVTKSTTHDVNSIPWKYKNRQRWRTVQLLAIAMLVVEPLSRSPPRNAVRFQSFRPRRNFLRFRSATWLFLRCWWRWVYITGASATATSD